MLAYDLVLYCCRVVAFEVPVVGGRARGEQRPRAPTLAERPGGRPRRFSLALTGSTGDTALGMAAGNRQTRSSSAPRRYRERKGKSPG